MNERQRDRLVDYMLSFLEEIDLKTDGYERMAQRRLARKMAREAGKAYDAARET